MKVQDIFMKKGTLFEALKALNMFSNLDKAFNNLDTIFNNGNKVLNN